MIEYTSVCDWCCKGPNLLLAVKKVYPNVELYARINRNDLRTKLILSKEIPEVKFVHEGNEDSMYFDVIVMNPPYDNSLHLQILEKVIKFADKIVNISPIRWLQDPFARYKKNSDYIRFENSVSKYISSLDVVENCNELFDIDFACNLAICTLDKSGGFDYQKFNSNTLVDKFVRKCKTSIADISTEEGYRGKYKSKYFGLINSHYGDYSRWINDKFDLFVKRRETNTNKVIFFENESEVRNCFDYLNSKVMRGYARLSRTNQRVPWQFVPAVDFNKHYTESELCKYFGITGYISDTEAEPGTEWETILNILSSK